MTITPRGLKSVGQIDPRQTTIVVAAQPRDNNFFGQIMLHKVTPPISVLPQFMSYGLGELQYRDRRGYIPGDIHASLVVAKEHFERTEPDSATTDWAQFVLVSIAIIETQMRMDYRLAYLTLKDWEQRLAASSPSTDKRTIVDQLLGRSVEYATSAASQMQFEVLPPLLGETDSETQPQVREKTIELP